MKTKHPHTIGCAHEVSTIGIAVSTNAVFAENSMCRFIIKKRKMNKELEKKVEQAVKLLQVCYKAAGEPLEVAYSGGKDSDVILELAKMSGIEYRAIYKNTTIDPPGTIKHVMENGVLSPCP